MHDDPVSTKLGVTCDTRLALLHAPRGLSWTPPRGACVVRRCVGHADVALSFYTRRRQLEGQVAALGRLVHPAGSLWIAWPKRSSGVRTDLTDHVVRSLALPLGLVDNKVCALDETWTALRFVWRRTAR